jgi:hypothetical protein
MFIDSDLRHSIEDEIIPDFSNPEKVVSGLFEEKEVDWVISDINNAYERLGETIRIFPRLVAADTEAVVEVSTGEHSSETRMTSIKDEQDFDEIVGPSDHPDKGGKKLFELWSCNFTRHDFDGHRLYELCAPLYQNIFDGTDAERHFQAGL